MKTVLKLGLFAFICAIQAGCGEPTYDIAPVDEEETKAAQEDYNKKMQEEMNKQMGGGG